MILNKQQRDEYFLTADSWLDGQVMVLQGPWRDEYLPVFGDDSVISLRLSHAMGWQSEDLRFLSLLPKLRGVEVYHHAVKDITPLAQLAHLEHIGLDCDFTSAPDFTDFQFLTHCFFRWRPKAKTLLAVPSLQHLNITGYPYRDLKPLAALSKLNDLKLASRKLETLYGIEQLSNLTLIDLFQCTALNSIAHLSGANRNLHSIIFDTCKKIDDIEVIETRADLVYLALNNCGPIQSLSPIRYCTQLEEIYFSDSTNILDGDLGVLLKIATLRSTSFANRRHYSHSREQIQGALKG